MAPGRCSPMLVDVPVHTLPVELLTRIFILGAGYDYVYAESPFLLRPDEDLCPLSTSDFQLLVSHVCRHWRQVALRISCLWTSLHFREPAHIRRAQAFLARCSSAPHLLDILVDTVSLEDHIPGVTLCRDEMRVIFDLICPQVKRWRSFHLKVRENECKLIARERLSTCGPAPNLETLQLYHFEDYRTSQNLYIATYRTPVMIFDNVLPRLKNVSLIGVNLPWAHSPYLLDLHSLELALHPDSIRPPYAYWDTMLRRSPHLRRLLLHYSGPRISGTADPWPSASEKIRVPSLQELSLTDLDPDHLCLLMQHLELPNLEKLSLDLDEQDFTTAVELFAGARALHMPLALGRLQFLRVTALHCSAASWRTFLHSLVGLRVLEIDFARVSDPTAFCAVLLERGGTGSTSRRASVSSRRLSVSEQCRTQLVLPRLEEARLFGLSGERVRALIEHRLAACSSPSSSSLKLDPASETSFGGGDGVKRWVVRWSARRCGRDEVLDELVASGAVAWVEDDTDEDEYAGENDDDDDEKEEDA